MLILKFLLFWFSATGYLFYFVQKWNLKMEFAPACYCAFIANMLFVAGLLNIMEEVTVILLAGGYVLLFLIMKKGLRIGKRAILIWLLYLGGLVYFAVLLRGTYLTHYDNFSHWATVIKVMLYNNRMPNFQDSVIGFQSYPLGSGLFIYYICRIAGTTDACMLWGQAIMLLSFLLCLVAFVTRKNWWCGLIIAAFSAHSMTAIISIRELLVDALLPLAAIAAFSIIFYYKDELDRIIVFAASWLSLVIQIKNSGLFFYAVCFCYIFLFCRNEKVKNRKRVILIGLLPLMGIFLWQKHVNLVFAAGSRAKHAMTIANYKQIFATKTTADMLEILKRMLHNLFRPEGKSAQLLIMTAMLAIVFWILKKFKKGWAKEEVLHMVELWVILLLYHVGLYGMYVFSMPSNEVFLTTLTGYDRYEGTGVLFTYGLLTVFLLEFWRKSAEEYDLKGYFFMIAAMVLIYFAPINSTYQYFWVFRTKQYGPGTEKYKYECLLKEYPIPEGGKYLVYTQGDGGYFYYLSSYELMSSHVDVITSYEPDYLDSVLTDHEYIIVLEDGLNIGRALASFGYNCPEKERFIIALDHS